MKHQTQMIKMADGLQLFTQRWLPEATPRAHILIVHGYGEHSGRYEHVARFFSDQGYAVQAYDHRGHGHSEGQRAYIDRFEMYLKDLTAVLDRVRAEAKKQPVFLFGHSMGGAVTALYVITRQPKLTGVLLSGAALQVSREISPLLQSISSVVGAWAPKLKTIKLDSKAISRDPNVVAAYENDPLVYSGGTYARTGAELIRASKRIQANMEKFKLPVLIMHGTADRLTDPEGSKALYERADSEDKTLKLYEGLYHEIFNEPEKELVLKDMLDWMEEKVEKLKS